MSPYIFISDRYEDKPIADVLSKNIQRWGAANNRVFQSTDAGGSTPMSIGTGLRDEIVKALSMTNLVILVLNQADVDYSFCMWECGIALDPAGSQPRIVVLQCADYFPDIFQKVEFRVQLNFESLKRFTDEFHKSESFLPGLPAFDPHISEKIVVSRADRLFYDLRDHIPLGEIPRATPSRDVPFDEIRRVFLCHSTADKRTVRTLYRRLREDGFEPWLDEEDLLGGQKWRDEIPKVLRTSAAVLVCLSHNCLTRAGYVQKEIKIALDVLEEQPEGRIFVIPIKLEDCKIPDQLKELHCLNYFDEGGHDRLQQSLRAALRAARGDLSIR